MAIKSQMGKIQKHKMIEAARSRLLGYMRHFALRKGVLKATTWPVALCVLLFFFALI